MDIIRKNYPELPAPLGPHHQSVRAGNMLFLAGVDARNTDAEHGAMAQQTDAVLDIIRRIVESEGGTLDNVVKVTNFVTDISIEAREASQAVRREYFGDNSPASTRVQVVALAEPHLLIEIEAIAVLPE